MRSQHRLDLKLVPVHPAPRGGVAGIAADRCIEIVHEHATVDVLKQVPVVWRLERVGVVVQMFPRHLSDTFTQDDPRIPSLSRFQFVGLNDRRTEDKPIIHVEIAVHDRSSKEPAVCGQNQLELGNADQQVA
jgi:hypothetical protein